MGTCRWTFVGPSCLPLKPTFFDDAGPGRLASSGRVAALALHPSEPDRIVYVGAASGGVWKTTDGGRRWTPLTDREHSTSTGAIVIDPTNGERIFVGTGEGNYGGPSIMTGAGVLRSEDGGASWVLLGAEFRFARITGMAMDAQGKHLFVSSTEGVFRSDDRGESFHELSPDNASHLVLDDRDPSHLRLYVALYGQGVFLSDGFSAPTRLTAGLPDPATVEIARIKLAIATANPDVLYAAISDQHYYPSRTSHGFSRGRLLGIFRSVDKGASWQERKRPLRSTTPPEPADDQVLYNLVIAVHPHDTDYVLLGMQHLFLSTDGANEWEEIGKADEDTGSVDVHVDHHAIAWVFGQTDPEKTTLWIGTDGGVFRSTDGGGTWMHRNRGLGTMQFIGGAHHPDVDALVLCGSQDNGAQLFEGHAAWRSAKQGDAGYTAIDSQRESHWYVSAYFKVARSKEYGRGFDDLPVGGEAARFYPPFVLAPSRPDILYFGSEQLHFTSGDGEIFHTIKEFDQEHTSSSDYISAIAVSPDSFGSRTVYVGTEYGKFYAVAHQTGIHAGVAASPSTPWIDSDRPRAFIADVAVSPRSSDRVYLVIGQEDHNLMPQGGGRVYVSDDRGRNWTDISPTDFVDIGTSGLNPAFNPVHAVAVDPRVDDASTAKERVFIGCDIGVFESRDGGATWIPRRDGLPNTRVHDLQIHAGGRLLRAVTYGRGVWELELDEDPCPPGDLPHEADLFLRDHRFDVGRRATLVEGPDSPLAHDKPLRWRSGPDVKVDVVPLPGENEEEEEEEDDEESAPAFQEPVSSVGFDGARIDYLGFQALRHRKPRRGALARVYLQVHNRGPDAARHVKARVFWAEMKKEQVPELPADFWSSFPDGEPTADAWKPIGPAATVAEVRPAEPEILAWEWNVPRTMPKRIGLLAIVTSPDDPVMGATSPANMSRDVAMLVRDKKQIMLRRTLVNHRTPATKVWPGILRGVGYAAGAVAAGLLIGYVIHEATDGD